MVIFLHLGIWKRVYMKRLGISMTFGLADVVNNNIRGAFREADDILMDGKKRGKNMVYIKRRERK